MRKTDLSAEYVRSLFRYDCETGKVYRHGPSVGNKARLLGVSPHKNKWRAHLGRRYLGLFSTPEAAHAAYLTAKTEAHLA